MINLLPIENKIFIKREYLRRLIVVFSLLSLAIIVTASLLLTLLLFLANKEKNDYSAYLSLEQKHLTFLDEEIVTSFVSDTNARVAAFEKNNRKNTKASEIIKKIINTKPQEIKINNFSYNENRILLSGMAQTRNSLQNFVDNLKEDESFKKIDSPISNFLKENDVRFNIAIDFDEK